MIWFLIFCVVFYFLLHHHKLGNHFYAVGGNRNAAVAIGINPARTKYIAFAICGLHGGLLRRRRGGARRARSSPAAGSAWNCSRSPPA